METFNISSAKENITGLKVFFVVYDGQDQDEARFISKHEGGSRPSLSLTLVLSFQLWVLQLLL